MSSTCRSTATVAVDVWSATGLPRSRGRAAPDALRSRSGEARIGSFSRDEKRGLGQSSERASETPKNFSSVAEPLREAHIHAAQLLRTEERGFVAADAGADFKNDAR
jgi:hypothetical protein